MQRIDRIDGFDPTNPLSVQMQELARGQQFIGLENNPLLQQQRVRQQAQDFKSAYEAGARGQRTVDLNAQAPLASQPATAGPHSQYGHLRKLEADASFYRATPGVYSYKGEQYLALSSGQAALTLDGNKVLDANELGRALHEKKPNGEYRYPHARAKLIAQNGIVELPNGELAVKAPTPPLAGAIQQHIPGIGNMSAGMDGGATMDVGQSALNFASRNSWLLYASAMVGGGGIVALGAAHMTAGALQKAANTSNGLALSPNGFSQGDISNLGTWGTVGTLAGGALGGAFPGMEHNLRAIMQSRAREFKDDAMISMIDNAGIPIEDLIFMFMAHMADNYEEKLREKMREAMIAEKLEERRSRRERSADMQAGMAQGIGGFFGPLGSMVGGVIGQGLKMKAMKENEIESALNGNLKSSTTLANEVQMLMHKWKQLNEMMSSLIKALHDMAMTPIRNIR